MCDPVKRIRFSAPPPPPFPPPPPPPLSSPASSKNDYVLYVTGADGVDDGGNIHEQKPGNPASSYDQKDWIWTTGSVPAKPPE
ncbi:MAG: hypothetical protein LBK99_19950 [Opitutaceae bacterium]|jgi:hypothetical protein|nr:hypothetical protein [Opitutaceae bacterium]